MTNDPWVSVGNTLFEWWPDAEGIDQSLIDLLRNAAIEQCRSYAPQAIESTYRAELAVCMQTQALYNAMSAGSGDVIGPDGLTVKVYPMDRAVKRLLRPQKGVPAIR